MTAPTLTEFLLARIAEDEAVAHEIAAERRRIAATLDNPIRGDYSYCADYDGWGPSVSVGAERAMATCRGVRLIVKDRSLRESQNAEQLSLLGERLLRCLAMSYANHPDFREEWRA